MSQQTMITPQILAPQLAHAYGLPHPLYLKREDVHPFESHKGRSIPQMIKNYAATGQTIFCISSSGNAAIAAAHTIAEHNKQDSTPYTLHIFIGHHIDPIKLARLRAIAAQSPQHIIITETDTPKQAAFQMEKIGQAHNVRQSTDDTALIGYENLADELAKIENLSAIFIPTSSGTLAQGLYNGFKKYHHCPQIHIVQTTACHPFIESPVHTNTSIAGAIVDKIGHRKTQIEKILTETGGNGWIASDTEIIKKISEAKEMEQIDISTNSALALIGLEQAIQHHWPIDGAVVCMITGR